MDDQRYMTIPPAAIVPGSLPKFKIYVLSSRGQYVLWTPEGNRITPEQLAKLSDSGLREVYIELEEEFKYQEYLETNLEAILKHEGPSDDQKAAIFSKVSTNVVRGAFETSFGGTMGMNVLRRTQTLIRNALIFVAESKSLLALAKMVGHDYQTYEHATKVLWFTVAFLSNNPDILEQIQPDYQTLVEDLRTEVLRQCGVAALLHDIGKALVSPEILNKNGILTPVEWEIMKRHPSDAVAMLLDTDIPLFVKKAILHHHEDFDGGGYPIGLEGPVIGTLARVLRIIDTFDAMTSRRPYKEQLSPLRAAQIMVGEPQERKTNGDIRGQEARDQGMRSCFDEKLLKRFIKFLGNMRLNVSL
jgi:HD-GYP domain-containing protein (c-di-GMP phosphodiesterase class II)